MYYIDRQEKSGLIRYYYGNKYAYEEALKENHYEMKLLMLADSVVNITSNEILKCRHMVSEIFDEYYQNKAFEDSIVSE